MLLIFTSGRMPCQVCYDYGDYLGEGMGPVPIYKEVIQALERDPDQVTWKKSREVVVFKHREVGLRIKFGFYKGRSETYMIVTKVKEECQVERGILEVLDRIVAIDSEYIVNYTKEQAVGILKKIQERGVTLLVTYPHIEEILLKSNQTLRADNSDHSVYSNSFNSHYFEKWKNTNNGESLMSKSVSNDANGNYSKVEQLNLDTFQYHSSKPEECRIDHSMDRSGVLNCVNCQLINNNRHSDESYETVFSVDAGRNEITKRGIPRQISELSESSSNKSVNSSCPLLNNDNMSQRKPKTDKLVKPRIELQDCPGGAGFEHSDLGSPTPTGRFNNLTVDGRAHSLPTTKESAVSMQDINVFEEQSQSLPTGHSSQGAEMCDNCHPKPGTRPRNINVGVMIETQEPLSEEYGNFLLKNPHLTLWDGMNTHVVEIDKGTAKDFGFHFKVKIGKNQDASLEVYSLVNSVQKEGVSAGKIRIGDWIRSVNGNPVQNPQQMYKLMKQANKEKTLRLLVQRPIGFSQNPNIARSKKSDTYTQVTQPHSPSPSAYSYKPEDPLIPGTIVQNTGPVKIVKQQNIYFSEVSDCNNESQSGILPFPKTVKFPKVKIFVCGSEAEKYGAYLLRDSYIEPTIQTPGYSHYQFSMATNCCNNVIISPQLMNLYASNKLSNSSVPVVDCSDCHGHHIQHCKQCGCDLNTRNFQNVSGSVVNVSLFIIPDDRLFHYCCTYLFTKSSLFILTFDGAKILRSASQEVSRLQSLSHTVRSFAGEECNVMSYGMLHGGVDNANLHDEVKTLFYTQMLNTPLQNYKIIGPHLIDIRGNGSDGDSVSSCHELKQLLWKTVMESIEHQHVLHPALAIVDYLQYYREQEIFITESQLMSIIKSKLSDYELDVHQMILTYLNEYGEIIIGKATPLFSQCSIGNIVLLNPEYLLSTLYHFIFVVSEDKQTWSRTNCTGFFNIEDFISILGFTENTVQCGYLTEFLECLQLIFHTPKSNTNNVPVMEYFTPYFIPLLSGGKISESSKKEHVLYVILDDHESYQTFYQVIFTLVPASNQSETLTFHGANLCTFIYKGVTVDGYFLKTEDRIKFVIRWEEKNCVIKPSEIFNWLHSTCVTCLTQTLDIQFTICVPCPMGENCKSDCQPKPHLVDIRSSKPQYCCGERIDSIKSVRQWKHNEPESTGTTVQASKKTVKTPMKMADLPWSVFNGICCKLAIPNALGNDWKGLAGLMDYSVTSVGILELEKNPANELLKAWERSCRDATVDRLIEYLTELDRKDIVDFIQKSLNTSKKGLISPFNDQEVNESSPSQNLLSGRTNNSGGMGGAYQNPSNQVTPIEDTQFDEDSDNTVEKLLAPGEPVKEYINVIEKGTAVSGLEEGTDSCVGVGVKLNNLDNNNQIDVVSGICSDSMITPVETPRQPGQIQNT
ncbi:Myeloid differentiation primary response protein MyD88 [Mactra antiquata]